MGFLAISAIGFAFLHHAGPIIVRLAQPFAQVLLHLQSGFQKDDADFVGALLVDRFHGVLRETK